jgi:MFS family permease
MGTINTNNPQPEGKAIIYISILQTLLKGFSVFYFLLLPILYAEQVITAEQLGYVGALLIVGILVGALAVTYKLHVQNKTRLLQASLVLLFGATLFLFWVHNIFLLVTAYILIGLAIGLGMSTINALAAQFTTKGKRYKVLVNMAMLMDVGRIIYPLIVGAIYVAFGFVGLIVFALVTMICFGVFIFFFTRAHRIDEDTALNNPNSETPVQPILHNKPFTFVMALEFLDSFASSQLFVFLPALLIFKHFTIEHALVMQSVVFAGYLSGRWLVGFLARRLNGFIAVGIAETGMVVTIILLLVIPPSIILYGLCFVLGVFTRGTSPVIKAMAFDRLESAQMRRGSAIHVISGDSGSAIGQFTFGILLAWFGVTAPFIAAAVCATVVALTCFLYRESVPKGTAC